MHLQLTNKMTEEKPDSVLTLLHCLIADSTIPYGKYAILANNGNRSSGDVVTINSNTFTTKCIQINLIDLPLVEGATLSIVSLKVKVNLTYLQGKWQISRVWNSPLKDNEIFDPYRDYYQPAGKGR